MEEKDFIKELFQEKLGVHEVPVNPELWTSVSSSLSTSSAITSSGLSFIAKSIIGGLSAAAVIGSVWFISRPSVTPANKHVTTSKSAHHSVQTSNESKRSHFRTDGTPHDVQNSLAHESIQAEELTDNGPAFGPGILHSGYGSASCGPDISLKNRENEVMPILPLQTMVSDQSIHAISENTQALQADKVDNEPSSIEQEETIILPNIFTPNADGKNDVFSIDLSAFEFTDYSLVVLDMNNHVVFKSNNPLESWNGKTVDGELCLPGNYVYYLTGKTSEGKTITNYSNLRIQY